MSFLRITSNIILNKKYIRSIEYCKGSNGILFKYQECIIINLQENYNRKKIHRRKTHIIKPDGSYDCNFSSNKKNKIYYKQIKEEFFPDY